jgi:hypothetical protein
VLDLLETFRHAELSAELVEVQYHIRVGRII